MISSISLYPGSLPYLFGNNHQEIILNLGGRYDSKHNFLNPSSSFFNSNYIENLFDRIGLISAIVGKNGTGKTTILKEIRDWDLTAINNEGKAISTVNYLKIYYTPFLSYEDKVEGENVINISKFSQLKRDLRYDNVGITEMLEIHNSEFLKNLLNLTQNEVVYNKLLELDLPKINSIKVKILKLKEEDWNISRGLRSYFNALEKIKNNERISRENLAIERLGLKSVEEIKKSEELSLEIYKIRLELEIINAIILKVKQILEHAGNKYLSEGFIDQPIENLEKINNYKDAFYWIIERAYIKPTENSTPIYFPSETIKEVIETVKDTVEQQENYKNWTEMYVPSKSAYGFINKFQNMLFAFKDVFTYDDYPVLQLSTDIQLSTGEKSMYEIFSLMNDIEYRISNDLYSSNSFSKQYKDIENMLILLDEGDIGFHPSWKKKYVNLLVQILPLIFSTKKTQIILTTHDPLTLSDIPTDNIIFLDKELDGRTKVISKNSKKTFGANIVDLLSDSFFLSDGLIGDFAKNKIEEIISWINENKSSPRKRNEEFYRRLEHYKKIISIIDERILKIKLSEMISELEGDNNFQREIISKEINALKNKLENL